MNKPAAIYARVSSDRQKEQHTIASQTAALIDHAQANGYTVPAEWIFEDEGYSGAVLTRPGLEALRDLAAEGQLAAVLVYSPDRLSRKYAYQVLLAEELSRCGVELVFLKAPARASPEDQLLLQFQGMIAEYERAQIAERSRRGKRHRAARPGECAVWCSLWLSLHAQERQFHRLLRGDRKRSASCSNGVRNLHSTRTEYQLDCTPAE